jgi:transcriptional regulator with XRE-family HTH domain
MKHRNTVGRLKTPALRERIRQAREMLGMTRAELARRVGVGASAAVQWEQARGTAPNVSNLVRIAQVTDVSFEWLSTGRGHARIGGEHDSPTIHRDCMAMDLYEESMLAIARKVPSTHREHLLAFLRTIYP